jgi:NADP-dependent alcohol dehydrogenase
MVGVIREKCNPYLTDYDHPGRSHEQLHPAHPTKVLFGKGQVAQLRGQIPSDARILVTYGGGSVVRSGLLDQIRSELAGLTLFEFGGIEPNPTYETLMGAVELARAEKVDFLLAVGGGSVLDGTKFIAAAAHYDPAKDPWHILETVGGEVASAIPWAAC